MEEAVGRYLGVFVPFIAALVCGHYILRESGSQLLGRTELGSPKMFRRAITATFVAVTLIVGVDSATGGDLFLRPRFPESQLLMTLVLVGLLLGFTVGRSLATIARRFKRIT
jgi:hypothetical protein